MSTTLYALSPMPTVLTPAPSHPWCCLQWRAWRGTLARWWQQSSVQRSPHTPPARRGLPGATLRRTHLRWRR